MITLTDLTKVYHARHRDVTALDSVNLHVRPGEVHGVIGRSGAGKSTLIRCVNLLERPTSGTVTVDGRELTSLAGRTPRAGAELRRARSGIGMIFQHFNLLSSRTAQGNVELPLEILGLGRRERARRARELLDLVGLADHARSSPARLSGGQRQRVGIARALAGDPKVLLSDEATSSLDPETTGSVLSLLRDLNRQLGLTVLLITHEMDVVSSICDSASLLRAGRIVETGAVGDLLASPGSALARELFPLDGGVGQGAGHTLVDLTFHGDRAAHPAVSQLARARDIDVAILGADLHTVDGRQLGRMRIELPGTPEANAGALAFLRERGVTVERVDQAAAPVPAPRPAPAVEARPADGTSAEDTSGGNA